MALNKYMHPRNPYKDNKPNFKRLAEKYEEFQEQTTIDEHGHFHIDFKKPECLKALSWALLKENFELDVLMPLDRLIPTIPLRLNYILWLEDILNLQTDGISGIDIGTGASCVYPLLGAKKNSWKFLATETDATNYNYAKKNVERNELTDKIKVEQVVESWTLYDILSTNEETYDFCMCNPPFFGSNFEAWGMLTSRSEDRPEPSSVNTASPVECIVAGGEVEFTKRMITDSLVAKGRVRVYSTMLGKKSSLSVIKEELRRSGVTNFSQTEFCQGKTMRWGIGWSFDESVKFPKPPSKTMRAEKPRPPLIYHIPRPEKDADYSLEGSTKKVLDILNELKIAISDDKNTSKKARNFIIEAKENTWSNQRRKRRQNKCHTQSDSAVTPNSKMSDMEQKVNENSVTENITTQIQHSTDQNLQQDTIELDIKRTETDQHVIQGEEHGLNEEENGSSDCKKLRTETGQAEIPDKTVSTTQDNPENNETNCDANLNCTSDKNTTDINEIDCGADEAVKRLDTACQDNSDSTSITLVETTSELPLFAGKLSISVKEAENIVVEIQWLRGQNRESIHQVLQYIKNKLQ